MKATRWAAMLCAVALAACSGMARAPDEARQALAPTGKLRVALFEGNPLHAVRDPSGQVKGVGYDLGKDLAARLGVEVEPILFPVLGSMLEAGKAGGWDIAFLGFDPERARFLDYTSNHLEVEYGFLVPAGSGIAALEQVDRPGVRVAVVARGSPEAFLKSALKQSSLVAAPALPAAIEMVRSGKADVLAGLKPTMHRVGASLPGSRVLDGTLGRESAALALPKGRSAAGLAYARDYIEAAKAGGVLKSAIDRAGLKGVVVAQGGQ